jgi:hypothetical protein
MSRPLLEVADIFRDYGPAWRQANVGHVARCEDCPHTVTRFLHDGRICLSNNAAERALRGIALERKSWLFAGSDRGGERAAVILTLIQTAKLNNVDPQAWLADVLARIADHKINDLAALLPWNWHPTRIERTA